MKKIMRVVIVIMLIFEMLMSNVHVIKANTSNVFTVEGYIEEIDISDFKYWQTGLYRHSSLEYAENQNYLCMNNCLTYKEGNTFTAVLPNDYCFIIRELDSNFEFVRTVTVFDSHEYTPKSQTKYIVLILAKSYGPKVSLQEYEDLFANTKIDLVPKMTMENNEGYFKFQVDEFGVDVGEYDFSEFDNWQSGFYECDTLFHVANMKMMCLSNFISINNEKEYRAVVPDGYGFIINEMDGNGEWVKSTGLSPNDKYRADARTKYIAVSLVQDEDKNVMQEELKEELKEEIESSRVKLCYYSDSEVDSGMESDSDNGTETLPSENDEADEYEAQEETFEEEYDYGIDYEARIDEKMDESILENCNLQDLKYWKSGFYAHSTGLYCANDKRVCLVDYKRYIEGDKFKVVIPEGYSFAIRELDSQKAFVRTIMKRSGDEYIPGKNAVYLAVSVVKDDNKNVVVEDYYKMLQEGTIDLISELQIASGGVLSDGKDVIDKNDMSVLDNIDIVDSNNWITGGFNRTTSKFDNTLNGISLKRYLKFSKEYEFNVTVPEGIKIVINEFDKDNNLLRTISIYDGGEYKPSNSAEKLSVSVTKSDGTVASKSELIGLIEDGEITLR